jgi:hypothetical protein
MIIFLPASADLNPRMQCDIPLDPEPIQKWAEEGFTVVGVTSSSSGWSPEHALGKAVDVLLTIQEVDIKNKFAVIGAILTQIKHRRETSTCAQCTTSSSSLPSQYSSPMTLVSFV